MNDINFFKPYLNKTNKSRSYGKYLPLVFISIIVLALIFYQFSLSEERSQLIVDINNIESEMTASSFQSDYNDAIKAQKEMETIKIILDESEKMANMIQNDFNVTKNLIKSLLNNVPENTYIVSMNYGDSSIKVDCISDSYHSAAQFVHNLKNSNELFSDIYMPFVNEDFGDYEYTINIEIGGDVNETNQ